LVIAAQELVPERSTGREPSAEAVRARTAYMRLKGSEIAKRQLAIEGWRTPPAQISSLLLDDLARTREVAPYRVESLLGINHNASLTAQYKTGKTNLLCDLAGCLADGRPFLGQLAVRAPYGRIGVWNDEMDRDDFLDYVRPIGVIYQARIVTAHLRGYRVPILTDIGMDWAVRWLFENQVEILLNDSWARLCAWSGIGENDNSGVVQLAEAINEIKSRAGSLISSRQFTPAGPSTTTAASMVEARQGWMTGSTLGGAD
jgi:hypothetical protein